LVAYFRNRPCIPSMYMCNQSVQPFVLLAITNPRSFGSFGRPCRGYIILLLVGWRIGR
jgi:hypothetical protein